MCERRRRRPDHKGIQSRASLDVPKRPFAQGDFVMTLDSNRRLRLRTEFSIDAFATETAYVPARARSTRGPGKLPPRLESLVLALPASAAWCAWSEGPRNWFVQGSLGRSSQDRPDDIIVRLLFRDYD